MRAQRSIISKTLEHLMSEKLWNYFEKDEIVWAKWKDNFMPAKIAKVEWDHKNTPMFQVKWAFEDKDKTSDKVDQSTLSLDKLRKFLGGSEREVEDIHALLKRKGFKDAKKQANVKRIAKARKEYQESVDVMENYEDAKTPFVLKAGMYIFYWDPTMRVGPDESKRYAYINQVFSHTEFQQRGLNTPISTTQSIPLSMEQEIQVMENGSKDKTRTRMLPLSKFVFQPSVSNEHRTLMQAAQADFKEAQAKDFEIAKQMCESKEELDDFMRGRGLAHVPIDRKPKKKKQRKQKPLEVRPAADDHTSNTSDEADDDEIPSPAKRLPTSLHNLHSTSPNHVPPLSSSSSSSAACESCRRRPSKPHKSQKKPPARLKKSSDEAEESARASSRHQDGPAHDIGTPACGLSGSEDEVEDRPSRPTKKKKPSPQLAEDSTKKWAWKQKLGASAKGSKTQQTTRKGVRGKRASPRKQTEATKAAKQNEEEKEEHKQPRAKTGKRNIKLMTDDVDEDSPAHKDQKTEHEQPRAKAAGKKKRIHKRMVREEKKHE
eukprot:g34958.t1